MAAILGGGVLAIGLAIAARPAFADPATLAHASLLTHASHHHRHHAHAPHCAALARGSTASLPASLPAHPAGLPRSGRANTAHHASSNPRPDRNGSRGDSFLAERFALHVDRDSVTYGHVESGTSTVQTDDVMAGRGPPRAGPLCDLSARSLPSAPSDESLNPNSLEAGAQHFARPDLGVFPSVAACASRAPGLGARALAVQRRITRDRLAPVPAVAAPEARRVA